MPDRLCAASLPPGVGTGIGLQAPPVAPGTIVEGEGQRGHGWVEMIMGCQHWAYPTAPCTRTAVGTDIAVGARRARGRGCDAIAALALDGGNATTRSRNDDDDDDDDEEDYDDDCCGAPQFMATPRSGSAQPQRRTHKRRRDRWSSSRLPNQS